MRISDWSSDVCSSDLRGVQPRAIEDSIQFDLAGEDHDFEAIISSRKRWNEPDEVTDGSTDWVIDWKLGGGVITIGDDAPFEAEFLDICFKEGRTADPRTTDAPRSEEHTSELQSLMRISYALFCSKKKNKNRN